MSQESGESNVKAFNAGFVAAVVGIVAIVSFVGDLLLKHFEPEIEEAMFGAAKEWVKEALFDDNLLPKEVYITQYYADGRDGHTFQTWKLSVKGHNHLRGEIEDLSSGNKVLVEGYWRASTLSLTYASASADRPGIGSFTFRPILPVAAKKDVSYAGLGLVHECECMLGAATGAKVNGPMLIVPAVITIERDPPAEIKTAFFIKSPAEPDIIWPTSLQKTVSAQPQ